MNTIEHRIRSVDDIKLPDRYRGDEKIESVVNELLRLGNAAAEAVGDDEKERAVTIFDRRVDALLDTTGDEAKFLLEAHPSFDINWLGYVRHCIGPVVQGRERLTLRIQPRGVGNRSGKR